MSRIVRISTIQLPIQGPRENREAYNLDWALRLLTEAGKRGSDIVCLPEAFSTNGIPGEEIARMAESLPGRTYEAVARLARDYGMYVIAPIFAYCEGILRNTAMVIGKDGLLVGNYHKVHLTAPELEWGVRPGDDYPVFGLDFGKVGIMTCFDNQFPEVARILALEGSEIIFFPHVQSGWGEVGWEIQLRARAIDNCVYIVSSSYGINGDDPWMPGMVVGRSGVIGPDGIILAEAGRYVGVVTCEIDLDRPRMVRCYGTSGIANWREETFRYRRPETYGRIVDGRIVEGR